MNAGPQLPENVLGSNQDLRGNKSDVPSCTGNVGWISANLFILVE